MCLLVNKLSVSRVVNSFSECDFTSSYTGLGRDNYPRDSEIWTDGLGQDLEKNSVRGLYYIGP